MTQGAPGITSLKTESIVPERLQSASGRALEPPRVREFILRTGGTRAEGASRADGPESPQTIIGLDAASMDLKEELKGSIFDEAEKKFASEDAAGREAFYLREMARPMVLIADEALKGNSDSLSKLARVVEAAVQLGSGSSKIGGVFVARRDLECNLDDAWRRVFEDFIVSESGSHTGGVDADSIRSLAEKPGPVLLEGSVGTGKTRLARQIADARLECGLASRSGPPRVVNFGALRDDLVDARLRGVGEREYTGVGKSAGLFESVDGGTLVLDDFQNASMTSQIRLLDMLDATSDVIRTGIAEKGGAGADVHYCVKTVLVVNESVSDLIAEKRLRRDILSRMRQVHRLPSWHDWVSSGAGDVADPFKQLVYKLMLRTAPALRRFDGPTRRWVPEAASSKPAVFVPPDDALLSALRKIEVPDAVRGLTRVIAEVQWIVAADDYRSRTTALDKVLAGFDAGLERPRAESGLGAESEGRRAGRLPAAAPALAATSFDGRREFADVILRIGEECDWVQSRMLRHLRGVRTTRVRDWIEREWPEVRTAARWSER